MGVLAVALELLLLAAPAADPDVEAAVAVLRHVTLPATRAENKAKEEALTRAWAVLEEKKEQAVARLRSEVAAVREAGEKDDFFLLSAAALYLKLGGLDLAAEAAALYEEADQSRHYAYVFWPIHEAARTRDPRALPLLVAALRNRESTLTVALHALSLGWAETVTQLWGVYGPGGLPTLAEVARETKDPRKAGAAALILGICQHLPALPDVRKLAKSESPEARRPALLGLGYYGHPDDYDLLVAGLSATDDEDLWFAVHAVLRYGDLRAGAVLRAMKLASGGRKLAGVVLAAGSELGPLGLMRDRKGAALPPAPEMDHDALVKRVEGWIVEGSIDVEDLDRPGAPTERRFRAVAGPEDIDLFLRARAAVYRRVSDEAMYEVRWLDEVVRWIGRSRYRANPGLCEKVEGRQ